VPADGTKTSTVFVFVPEIVVVVVEEPDQYDVTVVVPVVACVLEFDVATILTFDEIVEVPLTAEDVFVKTNDVLLAAETVELTREDVALAVADMVLFAEDEVVAT